MEGKTLLGFGLILFAILMLILPNPILYLDNSHYNYPISFNDNGSSILNISFDFNKNVISKEYEISNGEKIYLNYVNVYITEFLDNSSVSEIPLFTINKNSFQPINRSYEYSLEIESETLNQSTQYMTIAKTDTMTIDSIELSYYGANYQYYNLYNNFLIVIIIILGFLGLLLLVI